MVIDLYQKRLRESIDLAYKIGEGECFIQNATKDTTKRYRLKGSCGLCDHKIPDLIISHFSFNSPHGACEKCHGL